MNIYLASWYNRIVEMRGYRSTLEGMGHKVTSRWIDQQGPDSMVKLDINGADIDDVNKATVLAYRDLEDVRGSNLLLAFTTYPTKGTGGHSIEFGYALALGIPISIVGPRENIFHAIPYAGWYPDWGTFLLNAHLPI